MDIPQNNFIDLGFNDIIQGTELFQALSIDPITLISPVQIAQLNDIAQFVNAFPEALPMIRGAMVKKPSEIDSLSHISRFTNLHKQRLEIHKKLDELEKELSLYE